MAITVKPRTGLKTYGAGSDPHPTRAEHNAMIDSIEANVVVGSSGLLAARPAAGKARAFYYATDNQTIYYDTGSAWRELTTVGGVAASGVLIGGSSSEGVSINAARADHVHALPLVTGSVNGAMRATDKTILDAATSAPTANTLVKNDANGRFQVTTPSAAADVAPKAYVDTAIATRAPSSHSHGWAEITGKPTTFAPSSHSHTWGEVTGKPTTFAPDDHTHTTAEIASGVFAAARLPVATQSVHGAMSTTDKLKLDRASSASTPSTLMMTDANGRFQALAPAAGNDVANKTYVDAQVDTAAPASHNHSGSNITSGTISPLRIANATAILDGLMSKADKADLDAATYLDTPGALVRRGSTSGVVYVPANAASASATPKSYVDAEIATRAPSSHSHTWASITSKPTTFAPSSHGHDWDEISGKPTTFAPASHFHSAGGINSGTLSNDRLKNISGGDDWLALSSGRGAMRIASDGGIYFTHDDNLTVGWTTGGALNIGTVPWSRITGEPSTYAPSAHNHSASQVTSGTFAYDRIRGTDQVHDRTATNRSVWVDADGRFGQNTSSIRFKKNVRDANLDPAAILRLRPRIYDRKNESEGMNELGLIAEEVEAEVPELALYDREGVLETVAYEKLPVALLEVVKTQAVEIRDLHRRLEEAGL